MNAVARKKGLGRGLEALLGGSADITEAVKIEGAPNVLPLGKLQAGKYQPRTRMDEGALQELAASIRAQGLMQPILVRPVSADKYEIIAGERRFRAARIAGLDEVPVLVRDVPDQAAAAMALIENIQREDLNPMETAQALERLHTEMNLSHEEIAARTGKDRTTITNLIRLLRLPQAVQLLVAERRLSMGHARAILGLTNPDLQLQMAEKAAAQGFSVRQVERLVKKVNEPREPSDTPLQDPNIKAAIGELEATLGTRVRIVQKSDERGQIEIEYYSQGELERIYDWIISTGSQTGSKA
jgi:ParB family chromosome partitioning protein